MTDAQPAENAADDSGENLAVAPSSPSSNAFSRWQPLIAAFDDKLLSGYAKETVMRLGENHFKGTHTTARCIWGPHTPPHVELRVELQAGTALIQVLRATIKLQSLQHAAEYLRLGTSQKDALNRLLQFEEQNLTGLHNGHIDRRDSDAFDSLVLDSANPTIAEYLPALPKDEVLHIRFDVKKSDMIVLPSTWFIEHMQNHPAAMQAHGQALINAFEMNDKTSGTLSFTFLTPDGWEDSWSGAFQEAASVAPFRDICANVRGYSADDLAFKNLDLSSLQQPARPNPATGIFLSRDHRTVALLVGSAEDLAYQRYREEKLFTVNVRARAFPDATSIISPSEDDLETYGIQMDGSIMMNQYIVIPLAGIRDLCPDVGTQVSMYLNVPHQAHQVPDEIVLSAAQVQDMAAHLEAELRSAEDRAEAAQEKVQQHLDRLMDKAEPDMGKVARMEGELETIFDKVYYRHAERYLFPFVKKVDPRSAAALPEETEDVQRWHSARLLVDQLSKQPREDDIAWAARLLEWVSAQGAVVLPGATTALGEAFRAVRIPLPYGIRADVALFSARTPLQSRWIRGFRRPPMKFLIPMSPLTGDLQTTFSQLFNDRGLGTQPDLTFQIRMWYEESDTTTMQECRAVTALNSVTEGSTTHQWWNHVVDFTRADRMDTGNLHTAFPELQKRFSSGHYDQDPDTKKAIELLKTTQAGFVTTTGCPGAGKSTWATEVCDAVINGGPIQPGWTSSRPVELASPEEEQVETGENPESITELATQIDQLVTAFDAQLGNSTWEQGIDQGERVALEGLLARQRKAEAAHARIRRMNQRLGLEDVALIDDAEGADVQQDLPDGAYDEVANPEHAPEPQVDATETDAGQRNGWDTAPEDQTQTLADQVQTVAEPVEGEPSGWGPAPDDQTQTLAAPIQTVAEPVVAPGWGEALATGIDAIDIDAPAEQAASGRFVWVTPTNRLAFDARERFEHKCPNKRIFHVFPWEREVFNALDINVARPADAIDEDAFAHLPWQHFTMANHLASYRAHHWDESSPAADQKSLSEVAKEIARSNREQFADALRAMEEFSHDKGLFKKNLAQNMQATRDLLEFALSKADGLVGTPVAISELIDHIQSWMPHIVVVDEAGRMHEASLMIPVSRFPGVPMLILGDPKQCTPFNRSDMDRDFKTIFAKQRKMSFLDRVSFVDAFDITLTANHRSHGSVADWAMGHFYHGRMKIVNGRSEATKEFHRYLSSLKSEPVESNSIFLDVLSGQEEQVGTSFINPTNALIVRELAVQLFRDAPLRNMTDWVKQQQNPDHPVRRGSIMIITGYAHQKRQYESVLDSISPAEIPPELLTVRTIDDSVSAEADIVIIDLVRTVAPGFLTESKRAAVMSTRARLGQIFVGRAAAIEWKPNLGDLYKFLREKNCVIKIKAGGKGWETWCHGCQQSGHDVSSCQAFPTCFQCEENGLRSDHAARNCPYPYEPGHVYEGPIGQLDNIPRNVIRFEKPDKSHGKRANVRQKRQRPEGIQLQREESVSEKRYRTLQWTDDPGSGMEIGDAIVVEEEEEEDEQPGPDPDAHSDHEAEMEMEMEMEMEDGEVAENW